MKILLVEDDPITRDKIVLVLCGKFNAEIVESPGLSEARALPPEKLEGCELILIDSRKCTPPDIEKFRRENGATQSIICGAGKGDPNQLRAAGPGKPAALWIERGDHLIDGIVRTVEELVKTERLTAVPLTDSDYCQIRTSLLLTVCPLKSPVWIRLSAEKYVKLFTEGDEFNREDHEKLTIKKGVEYLYIRKNDIGEFISKFQADLTQLVNRSPPVTAKEIPEISEMTVETFQELGKRLGFEKAEVQEIAKSQVQMAMNVMGKTPGLNQFMELLKGYQGQYISSHSTLCGFMACSIAAQMQWGSDITFRKLSLASFLHDIVIDKHDLAAIRDVQELEASSFTPEQKKQYMNHPIEAAEIAKGFSEVPPDVDVIIAQHHERPDGKGFPRGLGSSYIAPLAAIFIVAHEMARYSLDKGPTFKAKDFLDASRDKYSSSQFKKVMAALEKLSS